MKKIILCLYVSLIGSLLNAKAFKPFYGTNSGCNLKVEKIKKINKVKLECQKFSDVIEEEFLDNKFLRWGTYSTKDENYVFIFFSKGVHGEKVILYGQKSGKKIKEITSSWPIEIEQSDNKFSFNYKMDSNEKGEFPPHYFTLK